MPDAVGWIGTTRYSGFYPTDFDSILKVRGIKSLIFTGATTSVCVDSTIRDAMFRGYSCVLLGDCTGDPIGNQTARSNHEAVLLTIQLLFGWVSTSGNLIRGTCACVMGNSRSHDPQL